MTFRHEAEGIVPVEYRYDFNGDGTIDNTVLTGDVISFDYQAAGTYRVTVTATDNAGTSYTAQKVIVAKEKWALDALLAARWHALSGSLQAQDIPASLGNLLPESRQEYEEMFMGLGSDLPSILATASPPELIAVEGNVAHYRIKRQQLWDGFVQTFTYYLWFLQDQEGVWRIDRF